MNFHLIFLIHVDISSTILQRKIELCENVLATYEAIHPGRTTERMNVIYELNCAKIIEMKIKLNCNSISRENAMVILHDCSPWICFHCYYIFLQIAINQCLERIKECYDALVVEKENKGIMEKRLERIMNESFL